MNANMRSVLTILVKCCNKIQIAQISCYWKKAIKYKNDKLLPLIYIRSLNVRKGIVKDNPKSGFYEFNLYSIRAPILAHFTS